MANQFVTTSADTNLTEAWFAQNIAQGGNTQSLDWMAELVSSTNEVQLQTNGRKVEIPQGSSTNGSSSFSKYVMAPTS